MNKWKVLQEVGAKDSEGELIAVNLDQKQPGFPAHVLPEYLTQVGVPFHIETQDTYSVVKEHIPEARPCAASAASAASAAACAGAFCTAWPTSWAPPKIVLGHHRDDMLQTFFLNMFFGGKLKGMPLKVQSDRGDHLIIRPLAYVAEDDLTRWAEHRQFPIIPCTLCGSQENLQRKQIGQMLRDWQQLYPGRIENMAVALRNLVPSHFMDPRQFDFKGLVPNGVQDADGDKALNAEEFPAQAAGMFAGLPLMPH